MTEDRQFPLQDPRAYNERKREPRRTSIPWAMLDTLHEKQAQKNHGQSLERLAERGGLGPNEMIAVLEYRKWTPIRDDIAYAQVMEHVHVWERQAREHFGYNG